MTIWQQIAEIEETLCKVCDQQMCPIKTAIEDLKREAVEWVKHCNNQREWLEKERQKQGE
jgi:hypothetical protein